MPIQAPTLVATYSAGPISTSPVTGNVTIAAGDVLVLIVDTSDFLRLAGTPVGGNAINWTLQQKSEFFDYANQYIWTATAPSAQNFTLSVPASNGNPGAQEVFWRLHRYSGSGGIGASNIAHAAGTPTLGITTTRENSALPFHICDWNIVDGSGRSYLTSAGAAPELGYARTSAATYYHAVHHNVGAAGAKTVGLSAPSGQVWTLGVVEVLGDTIAPSQVTDLKATPASATSVRLDWTAATDNVGVASYTVRRGGSVVASGVTATSWTDTGLAPSTHVYTVQAVDTSGNAGPQSGSASASLVPVAVSGSGSGSLASSAASVGFPGALTLDGSSALVLTNPLTGFRGSLALDGSGGLALAGAKWGYRGNPMDLGASGDLALADSALTIVTALALGGTPILGLLGPLVEVPSPGSFPLELEGGSASALDGHPGFSDFVPLSGSGQLVWTPVDIKGSGELTLTGLGRLAYADPNSKPIYFWTGESWRPADVFVWNGRAWLPLRANDIHVIASPPGPPDPSSGSGSLTASGIGQLALAGLKVASSGGLALAGSGALATTAPAPASPGSLPLGSAGQLALAGTSAAVDSLALDGSGALGLSGAPALLDALGLSGMGTLVLTGAAAPTEYRITPNAVGPSTSVTDGQPLTLGVEFALDAPASATKLHFWRSALDVTGTITGRLWEITGAATGVPVPGSDVTFVLSGTGWQTAAFSAPITLNPAKRYIASVRFPDRWSLTTGYWDDLGDGRNGYVNGPLRAHSSAESLYGQAVFTTGSDSTFPDRNGQGRHYWIDVSVVAV
ncbi:DUF4082 domain-containing protein [Lentzea sp. JNUCC 0626]|uniref:DUF4082 domain-containing protein n=1 Tax=Lentzea sp. JNUCC 0626 TaxID=3367513 RepID=UPI003747DD0E